MHRRPGLTLIEALIVTIVLAILAAVVTPKLTQAQSPPRQRALHHVLQNVRGQLAIYRVQHLNQYPTLEHFEEQMTQVTKADGTFAPLGTQGFDLGPYLHRIPQNPLSAGQVIASSPVGTSDWHYNEVTGAFRANHHPAYVRY
jgi:prepilin-type N-terminal cleavage/methylation domain-containing protein